MAQRGKPSTAHEYDKSGACIYCGMYKNNVDALSHTCTPQRESEADAKEEKSNGKLNKL